jgi:tRNA-modifying protein YgfZ
MSSKASTATPLATLTGRSIIALAGDDVSSWLQNLITADTDAQPISTVSAAALLTPQGKILFDFLVWKQGDASLALECRTENAAALAQRLMFYKLRAKVEIAQPQAVAIIVLANEMDGASRDMRFSDPIFRKVAFTSNASTDEAMYTKLRIENGVAESGADYALGDVFPHDVNLDQIGGVGFKKGCFVGQEVVSRMQHRGTARRRIVSVEADTDLQSAGAMIEAQGKEIGTLASTHSNVGLAILRLDRLVEAKANGIAPNVGGKALTVRLPTGAQFTLHPQLEKGAADQAGQQIA